MNIEDFKTTIGLQKFSTLYTGQNRKEGKNEVRQAIEWEIMWNNFLKQK